MRAISLQPKGISLDIQILHSRTGFIRENLAQIMTTSVDTQGSFSYGLPTFETPEKLLGELQAIACDLPLAIENPLFRLREALHSVYPNGRERHLAMAGDVASLYGHIDMLEGATYDITRAIQQVISRYEKIVAGKESVSKE
jgi:hypothetical protein